MQIKAMTHQQALSQLARTQIELEKMASYFGAKRSFFQSRAQSALDDGNAERAGQMLAKAEALLIAMDEVDAVLEGLEQAMPTPCCERHDDPRHYTCSK